ncbi:hypothetical protein GEMRC1_008446 [Eukaryota sp. GEM-RC1]
MKPLLIVFTLFCLSLAAKTHFHLVAHSHTDPGWLKSFDEYYRTEVVRILQSVHSSLQQNPSRRFVWSDISFFAKWYESLSQADKTSMKKLIDNNQFSFVQGGWVSHDEASPTPESIALQLTIGHEWLRNVLGITPPKVSWQIDPFGHSSSSAALSAYSGFEMLILNRIHYQHKQMLKDNSQLEFLWQGTRSAGKSARTLVHLLYKHYSAPKGFDFEDVHYSIAKHNVQMKADQLLRDLKVQAKGYPTNHVMVPVGDDFKFKQANKQYENWERLIENINSRNDDVEIFWSTPEMYLEAINKEKKEFPVFYNDFFPYADNSDSYWSGFYSTSPVLKGKVRENERWLKYADLVGSLALVETSREKSTEFSSFLSLLDGPRKTVALLQHHDAITGTAKHATIQDYDHQLDIGLEKSKESLLESIKVITGQSVSQVIQLIGPISVIVVNPDHVDVTVVRLRLTVDPEFKCFEIVDSKGKKLEFSIKPSIIDPSFDGVDQSLSSLIDVDVIVNVLPFSVSSIKLIECKRNGFMKQSESIHIFDQTFDSFRSALSTFTMLTGSEIIDKEEETFSGIDIESPNHKVKINKYGELQSITVNGKPFKVSSSFREYQSHRSGSYLFRPDTKALPMTLTVSKVLVTQSKIDGTVTVWYKEGIAVKWSINDIRGLETEFSVKASENREVVVDFKASFLDDQLDYYTDNGLEMVLRNSHSSMIAADYLPSVSRIALSSSDSFVTLLHSQAVGTRSDKNSVEVMVARNLKDDDGRGIGQGNRDSSIARHSMAIKVGKGSLIFDHCEISSFNYPAVGFFADSVSKFDPVSLFKKIPEDLKILSIAPRFSSTFGQSDLIASGDVILRVMGKNQPSDSVLNPMQNSGDYDFSKIPPIPVDIRRLFITSPKAITKTSLSLGDDPDFNYQPSGVISLPTSTDLSQDQSRSREFSIKKMSALKSLSMSKPDFVLPLEVQTFIISFSDVVQKPKSKVIEPKEPKKDDVIDSKDDNRMWDKFVSKDNQKVDTKVDVKAQPDILVDRHDHVSYQKERCIQW